MPSQRRAAVRFLSGLRGRDRRLGALVSALRLFEGLSQAELARRLDVSRAELNDYEKDRRHMLPPLAAKVAAVLGYDQATMVAFAVEDWLRRGGLHYEVSLKARRS
jgi:transcriptional regulator with XRE-family HTH domain